MHLCFAECTQELPKGKFPGIRTFPLGCAPATAVALGVPVFALYYFALAVAGTLSPVPVLSRGDARPRAQNGNFASRVSRAPRRASGTREEPVGTSAP